MATVSVSEARATLPDVLDRVARGEEVTITRHGSPVAVVVRPDALRSRRAADALGAAERARQALDEARHRPRSASPPLDGRHADELVAAIRADRDARG